MLADPNRVKEIFLAATDQTDEAARAAYLDGACGNDRPLRERVEALLRSHEPAGSFLGTPAAVVPDPASADTMAIEYTAASTHHVNVKPRPENDGVPFLSPSTRPDSLGRLGHYEMLQVLGHGGFGIVFRAFDDMLQRVVAVKVLAPQIATLSPARKRFLREARSSAQVRHDNVVHIYDVGEQPLPYLVMEFVPGETLQQKLERSGPLETPEVLRIGRQIAEGLAAAHACGLIHRDIKPANILLEGGSHKAKITDFGLARAADDASISQSGLVAGTPMFMSPEQALGDQIDQRADLFSLGSVLYQMVSGRPPFRAPSMLAVLKRVAEEQARPIAEIIPETPAWLCAIIAKLHAKKPVDRFQSAREVAELLADCEANLKTKQDVKYILPAPVKPAGWKKWAAAGILLLPLIVLAVTESAGMTDWFQRRQTRPDPIKPAPTSPVVAKTETPIPVVPASPFLKPIEMKSAGGATLTLQDDGSILVSGEHPDKDVYTLTFRNLPAKIQALRLEVLPHASLPNQGPGRHRGLPFVLSAFKSEIQLPGNQDEPHVLKFVKAWADSSVGIDSLPGLAIDMNDDTGWSAENGKAHFAVFELAEPVAAEGMVLRVILECKHEDAQRQLGCFRLSAAADANAFK